ncbi:TPA: energy-coupling factor transporter transmembrane component T [Streptococcus agalactiae]
MRKVSNVQFNPCTKIVLLFLCIIISSLLSSIELELIFVFIIALFCIINKKIKFALNGFLIYLGVYFVSILTVQYGSNTLRSLLMPFLGLVHKLYPVCMFSVLILSTTKVGEFLSTMEFAGVSKKITIPLAVMLRYIPTVREDWIYIKDSMYLRSISPSFFGFIKNPDLTIECIYSPIIIMASKAADELTIASITRGIESPKKRSSIIEIRFDIQDVLALLIGVVITVFVIYRRFFCD